MDCTKLSPLKYFQVGSSAGAVSTNWQLVGNADKPEVFFHAAVMARVLLSTCQRCCVAWNSGGPTDPANLTAGQRYYDILVSEAGCAVRPALSTICAM